ncbi:hypothetical protein IFM89_022910 [Coptis chinensis]|uniref:Uncharacterized protein n=1 Tax=Coptis chinensis TaxID=261450 RepID=A0A835IP62_9MAGN|nr:hypothetical protein IFM89_022910 [Coptis chinensis]
MQVKEGTLEVEGTKDVLTLALGTLEHNGRVRGVGDGVTPTQYFHLIKRGSKKHPKNKEEKSCLSETNSEPDFGKVHGKGTSHSLLPNLMLPLGKFKTKKANSPIPATNSKKENAEVTSRAPGRNHTLDLGKEKIGQPSKSKGKKTKSAGHSKGSNLCTSFGAMIGTIIQSGRLKFPYGQELFGANMEFSYIETNDVKDVRNLESVKSPCMVAYIR